MAHPWHHALSSAKKYGGRPEDYLPLHAWFDASKSHLPDFRHRALRHHSQGIFWLEEVFGTTITNSDGRQVPVRFIGEQHVREDLGFIPTLQDWFKNVKTQAWMLRTGDRTTGRDLEEPTKEPACPEPACPTSCLHSPTPLPNASTTAT